MTKRYLLIDFSKVTEQMVKECIHTSIRTLRHVKFKNDTTDYVLLKWRGDKFRNELHVSKNEILERLKGDINYPEIVTKMLSVDKVDKILDN